MPSTHPCEQRAKQVSTIEHARQKSWQQCRVIALQYSNRNVAAPHSFPPTMYQSQSSGQRSEPTMQKLEVHAIVGSKMEHRNLVGVR